jgi:hypothetical protein
MGMVLQISGGSEKNDGEGADTSAEDGGYSA